MENLGQSLAQLMVSSSKILNLMFDERLTSDGLKQLEKETKELTSDSIKLAKIIRKEWKTSTWEGITEKAGEMITEQLLWSAFFKGLKIGAQRCWTAGKGQITSLPQKAKGLFKKTPKATPIPQAEMSIKRTPSTGRIPDPSRGGRGCIPKSLEGKEFPKRNRGRGAPPRDGRHRPKQTHKKAKAKKAVHPAKKSNISKLESDQLIKKYKPIRLCEINRRIKIIKNTVAEQLESLKNYIPSNPEIPKITEIDWEHLFKGSWDKLTDKLSGYHSTWLHPEYIDRMTVLPNEKGIYEIIFKKFGKLKMKPSTMFQDRWDGQKIIQKIIEAYKNPILIEKAESGITIIGKTTEGIKIKIFIKNNGKLRTAYNFIKKL